MNTKDKLNQKSIFEKSFVLKSLNAEDLTIVYDKSVIIEFSKKTDNSKRILFDKGDVSNCLYILISGIIDITTIDLAGKEHIIASYDNPGDYFGEQALFDTLKIRMARAVFSSDNCILRKINQKEFYDIILAKQDGLHETLNKLGHSFFQKNSLIFSRFLADEASHEIYEENIEAGTWICKEKNTGERFYLVLGGYAKVFKKGVFIAELIGGNYFGFQALINEKTHDVSIKAESKLRVVSISGNKFLQLYNDSEVIREYIEKMDSYQESYQESYHGMIYSEYHSHYKNKKSMTRILTSPNGFSCSITKVLAKKQILKVVKQIDIIDDDGKKLGKEDIALCQHDLLISSLNNEEYPRFYLHKNNLVAAEIEGEYIHLDRIIPAIMNKKIIWPWQKSLYRFKKDLWINDIVNDPTDSAVICSCLGVTRGELKRKVAFGCVTTKQLANETGASLACGFCKESVAKIAASKGKMIAAQLVSPLGEASYCNKKQNIKYFRFKPKNEPVDTFLPGQHIKVESKINGQWVQRSYTLTSDANQQAYYEIAVKREEKGVFSRWLHDKLREDSEIFISKPQGSYHLTVSVNNPVVFFIGGVGVTPAIAFLRYLTGIQHKFPLYIDYSVSTEEEIAFEEAFRSISEAHFKINLRITKQNINTKSPYNSQGQHITLSKNRISKQDVENIVLQYPDAEFYICGSSLYDEAINNHLSECDIKPEKIHSEHFDNSQKRSIPLFWVSFLSLFISLMFFILPSYKIPESIGSFKFITFFPSEYTGYGILGLGIIGLIISLPRRWKWVQRYDSSTWRLQHAYLGLLALILLFFHTGFSMGSVYTMMLTSCFLVLCILGSTTGISIAAQEKISPATTYIYKKYTKLLHILAGWPLPALLLAHIFSTYIDSWF